MTLNTTKVPVDIVHSSSIPGGRLVEKVHVRDGDLLPLLQVLCRVQLLGAQAVVPVRVRVGRAAVVDPVDEGKDAHEADVGEGQGVGQEDPEVRLGAGLVVECPERAGY